MAIIDHPPGAETPWDWLELPDSPRAWAFGATAHLLVGAFSRSSKWRAVLAEAGDQAHLVEGLHAVSGRLGGLTRRWRFNRMATVCHPASGKLSASFAAVAKFYGVGVDICPARHGNRKGVVEKGNHSLAQRWWRTLPDELSPTQAQAHLDGLCVRVGDGAQTQTRRAAHRGRRLAASETLRALPRQAYPVTCSSTATCHAQVGISASNAGNFGERHQGAGICRRRVIRADVERYCGGMPAVSNGLYQVDVAVIGGGIVGLAAARAVLGREPAARFCLA